MNAYRFKVPLKQQLSFKGQAYIVREGILIESDGSWAEASPMPGFSLESIEDVVAALRGEGAAPPSLEFALTALGNAFESKIEIPFNHLLLGDAKSILAAGEAIAEENCHAVKVKVGQRDLFEDIELVKELRGCLPDQIQLRLDANQSWEWIDAVTFIESIEGLDLEYIEEPLQEPGRLEELYSQTGVRYALDESILQQTSLDSWPNAVAMICKPTILGGRKAIERLVATGKPVVFSAAFESGVGIARIMQLASEFSPGIPAGLDTLDWLSDDLLLNSPQKRDGKIAINRIAVDLEKLERIEL